jgi:hypothetical protein
MLNVFLTVDTEVWPRTPDWRETRLERELRCDIDGVTAAGDFGLPYQLRVLGAHGLKAVFFVEALFADAVGREPVEKIVALVRGAGHEVGLHLHSEWLRRLDPSPLPGRTGSNLRDFGADEQAVLVARGLETLRACGAPDVYAFRAGNYGANNDTLVALARNGVTFDTSHNTCYLGGACDVRTPGPLLQPRRIEGVWEFPVAFFRDWPGHNRHAQLCACSGPELEGALLGAWRRGWFAFVIVSHSFELVKRPKGPGGLARPDRVVIRRFERLCRFLAAHRDKFGTAGFGEIDPAQIPAEPPGVPLRSGMHRTAWRFGEQLVRRLG